MQTDYQSSSHIERNDLNQLLRFASDIERKFDHGQAGDIRPDFIQNIIKLSVSIRKKTNNDRLKDHLADIEDTSYAILDNTKEAGYYKNLRALEQQLKSVIEFE